MDKASEGQAPAERENYGVRSREAAVRGDEGLRWRSDTGATEPVDRRALFRFSAV